MDIEILYEKGDILVINKQTGLLVHPRVESNSKDSKQKTLSSLLLEKYPNIVSVGEPLVLERGGQIDKPGIVHRLDKDTSGTILVAKTQETFLHLKSQFQARTIKKTYRAFVYGKIKDSGGAIDHKIGRSSKDFRLRSAERGARGTLRDAYTEYKVIKKTPNASYLELYPKTGRTHQIRVHAKSIGHPVVCDKLYAPKRECILGFNRLALHALSIQFVDLEGTIVCVEAPLPNDFVKGAQELSNAG